MAKGKDGSKQVSESDQIIDYNLAGEQKKFSYRLLNLLKESGMLTVMGIMNSFISILLVIQFVIYTYYPDIFQNTTWAWCNVVIHLFLFLNMSLEVVIAPDLLDHLLSHEFFIDLILTLPFFTVFALAGKPPDLDPIMILHVTYCNILSVFKLRKLSDMIENDVNKKLVSISMVVLSIILVFAGLIQYLYRITDFLKMNEANKDTTNKFGFYDYIFFVMTIVSTVGYENPFFSNDLLRLVIVFVIVISILIIPAKSSDLIDLLSNKSMYSRISYKRVNNTEFIVLCGSLGMSSVGNFLAEFFHPDHGNAQKHCIILSPNRPDNDMENLMRDPKYEKVLVYIQGNPMDDVDLRRAQADKAKAVIIMCNKHSINPEEEDSKTLQIAIFIKKFLGDCDTRICVQILRTDGKNHYSLPSKPDKKDQLICLEELKLSLFAKSCLCPGLIAMVTNLINSAGELKFKEGEKPPEWLEDYWHGFGFEIYRTKLPDGFKDKTFSEAAHIVYEVFNAILFGIEVESSKNVRILINPGNKRLTKSDNIYGYIIAEDKDVAVRITEYVVENFNSGPNNFGTEGKDLVKSVGKLLEGGFNLNTTKLASGTNEFSLHIQKNCYISKSRIELADVTYETMNGNLLAANHIILVGLVSNLHHFIVPLRSKYLGKFPPIVILNEEKPDAKTWGPISYFQEIYFVKGSALNEKDLYRVNIMKAIRVVILSNRIEISHDGTDDKSNLKDKEDLLDAQTIFKYLNVTRIRRDIPIITDLVHPMNISFLINSQSDYKLMKEYGYFHTQIYAMGETYISSVMDTLIAQAFYNSALIGVLDQVIIGNTVGTDSHEETSNLFPLKVPTTFVGRKFSELFEFLVTKKHIVALGLYRYDPNNPTTKPYIVTNPNTKLILTSYDMVFVLAKAMINYDVSNKWGSPLEDDDGDTQAALRLLANSQKRPINRVDVEQVANDFEANDYLDKLHIENKRKRELRENVQSVRKLKGVLDRIQKKVETLGKKLESRHTDLLKTVENAVSGINLKTLRKSSSLHRASGLGMNTKESKKEESEEELNEGKDSDSS